MTIKSKTDLVTELTTNFPDNIVFDITPAEFRTMIQDILDSLEVYGGLYVADGAVAQSLTTTPAKLTGWAGTFAGNGTTPSSGTDDITVSTAGVYKVEGCFTLQGEAAITYKLVLRKQAVAVTGIQASGKPAGVDDFTISFVGLVTCAASDVLSVYGESSDAGGKNLTMVDCQLIATRIP